LFKKQLLTIAIVALVFSTLSWAQIDKIALFTEQVSWTDVATAEAAADYIMSNVDSANDIAVYSEADIGTFAEDNTGDGDFDIIITFGWFPPSLYPAENAMPDDSVGEKFLESGDMLLNTADYIFYVSNPNNGDTGLKNMTDSEFDMWTDGTTSKPTDAGTTYTPSVVEFGAGRCFRSDQIDADADWEVEVAFGASDDGINVDPAIIRNLTYGGRVAIAFQAGGELPRAEVITEMIENYVALNVTPVEPKDKLATTWGGLK